MLMMRLIVLGCFYLVLLILFFTLRQQGKLRKSLCLGLTFPIEYAKDDALLTITKEYKKKLLRAFLWLLPWPLIILPFGVTSIIFCVMMIWLIVAMIVLYCPYIKAHKKLLTYKSTLENLPPDDDAHWKYGMFYNNPDDHHSSVPKRIGHGTTVNIAKPMGKATILLVALVILALPVLGGWLVAVEYTPVEAELTETALIIRHTKEIEIPKEEITSVSLLPTLPYAKRIVGTSIERLLKGTFHVTGFGTCTLHLDPTEPPFLVISTEKTTHIINCPESADTLYTELVTLAQ